MKKRLNDKGFSLVELIIVIAIMAILIGGVAPQVIKYVERSREAKDLQVLQTVFTAAQTTILTDENAIDKDILINLKTVYADDTDINKLNKKIQEEILSLTGSDIVTKLISKKANPTDTSKKDIYISYKSSEGEFEVGLGTHTEKITGVGPVTN